MVYDLSRLCAALGALVIFGFMATAPRALEAPSQDVILTISGEIDTTNMPGGTAQLDLDLLQTFTRKTITTVTPWTDGLVTFEGALLKDVLEALGAKGQTLKATAINDYSVDIPLEDIRNYNVIIAYKKNGALMSVRDKGPLWIIYPWDKHPELKTEAYHARSIWQLNRIFVY